MISNQLEQDNALANGLEALAFARRVTMGLLEDFDDELALHRPLPEANHAMWIAGHIAWDDDFFLSGVAGRASKLPEEWKSMFCSGSTVFDEADQYPALAEVLHRMSVLRENLRDWFGAMSPADLAGPLPEGFERFGRNRSTLMSTLAWHEGLHAGQLTVIRKSLKLGPRFG